MKPLLLEIEGFGAFRDKQTIDFSALQKNGLFLISGPTGSGKSTILDALCFALYGRSGSADRDHTLKSDFTPENAKVSVRFVFEIRGKQYEAMRVAGKSKKDISLSPLPDREYALDKKDEFDAKIKSLIGFGYDQFTKVVMLPQGKFQELLFASDDVKGALFKQLFRTGLYERVESILKTRATEARAKSEKIRNSISGLFLDQGIQTIEELNDLFNLTGFELEAKKSEYKEAENRSRDFLRRRDLMLKILQSFADHDEVAEELRNLESQKPEYDNNRVKLVKAEAAADIQPAWSLLCREKDEALKADKEREAAANADEMARSNLDKAKIEYGMLADLEKEKERTSFEFSKTTDALKSVNQVEQSRKQLENVRRTVQTHTDTAAELEKNLPIQIEESEKIRTELRETGRLADRSEMVSLQLSHLQKQNLSWNAVREVKEKIAKSLLQLESTQKELSCAQAELDANEKKEVAATSRFLEDSALFLAQELSEGEACPVCGSKEHPSLATGKIYGVSAEELDQIRRRTAKSRKTVSDCSQKFSELKASLEAMQAAEKLSLSELEDEDALRRQIDELNAEMGLIKASKVRKADLDLDLTGILDEIKNCRSKIKDLSGRIMEDRQVIASLESEIKTRLIGVPDDREAAELETEIEALKERQEAIELRINSIRTTYADAQTLSARRASALEACAKRQSEIKAMVLLAQKEFDLKMGKSGFGNVEEFQSSMILQPDLLSLRKKIQEYDNKVSICSERKVELEKKLHGTPRPDEELLEKERAELKEEADRLSTECTVLAQKKDALQKKIVAGNDLNLQLKDAQSLSSDLEYLHSAAAGKSGKNIPFSNYVQSSLLDDVLEAANSRFDKMSKGRFSFRRTDEKGHRKQSAGLEIVIFDQYTATERPAKSLSGGESFMASLSLAMGLSDTVQNHSGGVSLDTVFIDEGFGSLDPDTLDSAMMVLGEMIPRGGLVGLISHVSELRERIPARIQVFKGREGSSLKVEA